MYLVLFFGRVRKSKSIFLCNPNLKSEFRGDHLSVTPESQPKYSFLCGRKSAFLSTAVGDQRVVRESQKALRILSACRRGKKFVTVRDKVEGEGRHFWCHPGIPLQSADAKWLFVLTQKGTYWTVTIR